VNKVESAVILAVNDYVNVGGMPTTIIEAQAIEYLASLLFGAKNLVCPKVTITSFEEIVVDELTLNEANLLRADFEVSSVLRRLAELVSGFESPSDLLMLVEAASDEKTSSASCRNISFAKTHLIAHEVIEELV